MDKEKVMIQMSDVKKCPLAYDRKAADFNYCAKAKCEWWVDNTSTGTTAICAIPLIALRLNDVAYFTELRFKDD